MSDHPESKTPVRDQTSVLREKLDQATVELNRRAKKIAQLEAEIENFAKKNKRDAVRHASEKSEIYQSTSWRLTKPIRWLKDSVQVVKGKTRHLSVLGERHGGFFPLFSRTMQVFRESGLSGVRRSFKNSHKPAEDYVEWVRRYDTFDQIKRTALRGRVEALRHKPLISVVMPTYNPNPIWLAAAIESVQAQIYPFWELCIADDASPNASCREVLRNFSDKDARIKVVYREKNGHISAASNSALNIASGEWTALMDHDDLLSEHALFCIADAVNMHPDCKLIYSDEDKIDADGMRSDPYFKPDWNVDLFYSQNMFSHLGAFDTALLRDVRGFELGMEGSQDYDLVLRCIERIRPDQIIHVPHVLYHWRVHAESTAASSEAKPYAQIAGERALNAHFRRTGVNGHVELIDHGYRAYYDLPASPPMVSLIIPTRNAVDLVRQCVSSICAATTYPHYEVILVDNGSDDPEAIAYFRELSERPGFKLIRDDGEFNYSRLNNEAVKLASGELVALVNNDIELISPDWLSEMVSLAIQPGVGAVGAKLWYPDDTLQHGGVVLGIGGIASHSHKTLARGLKGYGGRADLIQSFSAVTAACLVVRKDVYESVGGLDERHLKVAFNDVDFCLRLCESGLRNVWTPYAEMYHHESATRGDDIDPVKQERFNGEMNYMYRRWGDLLKHDPAYNLNLTLSREDFNLAWPPRHG